jgi:hypothetical protein
MGGGEGWRAAGQPASAATRLPGAGAALREL